MRVDPRRIPGSPRRRASVRLLPRRGLPGGARPRGSRASPARPRRWSRCGRASRAMSAGTLAPTGDGGLRGGAPRRRAWRRPVVRCCDRRTASRPCWRATVAPSAPVTSRPPGTAAPRPLRRRRRPGGLQVLRRVDPAKPGAQLTIPRPPEPAVAGPGGRLAPDRAPGSTRAAPTALLVQPDRGAAAPARGGPARPGAGRLGRAGVIVVARARGRPRRAGARRRGPPGAARGCGAAAARPARRRRRRVGGGRRRPRACARRAARCARVATARAGAVDAVGVDGRRVAWVERGVRRGARVGVVRLGRGAMRRPAPSLAALVVLLAAAGAGGAAPIVSLQDDDLVNVRGAALEARLDALAATGVTGDPRRRPVGPGRAHAAARRPRPGRPGLRLEPLRPDRARPVGPRHRGDPRLLPGRPRGRRAAARRQAAPRPADGARFAGAIARRYSGAFPDPLGRDAARGQPHRGLERAQPARLLDAPVPPRRGRPGPCWSRRGAYAALLAACYREIHAANPRRRGDRRRRRARRADAHVVPEGRPRRRRQPRLGPPGWPTRGRRSTRGACTSTPSGGRSRRSSSPPGAPCPGHPAGG